MIASFFGLITVSQLGLGFYWCVFLALQARESPTKCYTRKTSLLRHVSATDPTDPT